MDINGVEVQIISGDIALVPSEVLIAKLDSNSQVIVGYWCDNISKAIIRTAGPIFHDQLCDSNSDGQMFLSPGHVNQSCVFGNVLFVLSELADNLYDVVLMTLKEADRLKMKSASLPAIHTALFYDSINTKINEHLLSELHRAVINFIDSKPEYLKQLSIVIYENDKSFQFLESKFKKPE